MIEDKELQAYLSEAAQDTIRFLSACAGNLGARAEQSMISSTSQYVDLVRKGLSERTDENSCVSSLDIIEVQINAFRRCLLDLEMIRDRMNHEEKLN
jgi:hypothetical protein